VFGRHRRKSFPVFGILVGDRLGRFEILGALGAGGMGTVYRARDPQLRREVAIKVLQTAFSGDPDSERRFEREARAAVACPERFEPSGSKTSAMDL
jgi:serine/threonine protein kinase